MKIKFSVFSEVCKKRTPGLMQCLYGGIANRHACKESLCPYNLAPLGTKVKKITVRNLSTKEE